ncbi:MAG TPA: barstar family protein [Niabella sp.]|jgi:ribonuclease inhibitor|nr:barstar family protein [Niabella sp.]HRO85819.1 barstar family protein [Niabella sp.]HUN03139.1 barstar family protein [Niabella sp.]
MNSVTFDFNRIGTLDDFYKVAVKEFNLSDHFGNNLDALWDSINGDIELPVTVIFQNLSLNQLEYFDKLILLFEEAAYELGDNFAFEYYLNTKN